MLLFILALLKSQLKKVWFHRLVVFLIVTLVISPCFGEEEKTATPVSTQESVSTGEECVADKFSQLKQAMEVGFQKGLPAKLKQELSQARKNADDLAVETMDISGENSLEINKVFSQANKALGTFIELMPKVAAQAPQIRSEFVLPLASLNYLHAEKPQCDLQQDFEESIDFNDMYSIVNQEMKRLTTALYILQTLSAQEFIAQQTELNKLMIEYNQSQDSKYAKELLAKIPNIVHSMQQKVDNILPGFELSKKYYSMAAH